MTLTAFHLLPVSQRPLTMMGSVLSPAWKPPPGMSFFPNGRK